MIPEEDYLRQKRLELMASTPKSVKRPKFRRNISNESMISGQSQSQSYALQSQSINQSVARCSAHEFQLITTMCMELHCDTRRDLNPDPEQDAIRAIFYSFMTDEPTEDTDKAKLVTGVIVVEDDDDTDFSAFMSQATAPAPKFRVGVAREDVRVVRAQNEMDMIMQFIDVVREIDPDILMGFEIEMASWGYLLERANTLNMQLTTPLSRLLDNKSTTSANSVKINGKNLGHFPGRVLLNLWAVLRHEITLRIYSYENCYYHVLHERIPCYTFRTMTKWFNDPDRETRMRIMGHHIKRTEGCLKMVNKLSLIPKTSTLARIYGIQFSEVLTRGSQFRVESMMLRYAKRVNLIPFSPTPRERSAMKAPEYIPLVMEPRSNFYTDPVVVLDFQSLYPSMMIAYNYCFSTCLGRVSGLKEDGPFAFGCSHLYVPKTVLKHNRNNIHVSPNGVAFVKESVRKGVLPLMLEEILETRLMVKNAMKENMTVGNKSKSLNRLLDARQLALKLVANVTYGYTAANFSGRMPCVEIADAIVSKGKETLQRAMEMVNNDVGGWGGQVIYGDTDSLFILFPGCSKDQAFRRGRDIAEAVTRENPKPVKLKFEKVFLPCVLITKKRYVGYSYESEGQERPDFLAKGIETVRRDSVNAAGKILEKSLRILFDSEDPQKVQLYVRRQFTKLMSSKLSYVSDFIFAKEYRGLQNYSRNARVPALELTRRLMEKDHRAEPRKGSRVPYVVVCGSPTQNIIALVHHPMDLIRDPSLKLNVPYYIERVLIPPLNRVFYLLKQDALKW